MKNKKSWLEFIIDNFKSGTVKEISAHIAKMQKKKNFKPSRKDPSSTVRYILPLHTKGRIMKKSKRFQGEIFFEYDKLNKTYHLIGQNKFLKKELLLTKSRSNNIKNNKQEISSYKREGDLSIEHNKMLDIIQSYADHNNIEYDIDKVEYIDVITENDKSINIYEVKSYEDSIYLATGQLKYYEYVLNRKYNIKKPINKIIVGNFKLQEKFEDFLIDINIKYQHISEFNI